MMRMHTNYQVPIRDAHELRHRLVETWAEFQRVWWTMRLISGERLEACIHADGGVVTLNTCCDIACLTFNCHTTQRALFTATDV